MGFANITDRVTYCIKQTPICQPRFILNRLYKTICHHASSHIGSGESLQHNNSNNNLKLMIFLLKCFQDQTMRILRFEYDRLK